MSDKAIYIVYVFKAKVSSQERSFKFFRIA